MISDAEFAELKAENEQLKQQIQFLLEQLKLAKHHQFGASSEKSVDLDGGEQLSIFNEAEALADPAASEPEIKEVKAYVRRKAGQVGLDRLPEDLPVEEIVHELPPEEQSCPECGNEMHVMGREEREELKFVPAKAVIVRHVNHTYACRHCEQHNDHVPVVKAPMPTPVIKGQLRQPRGHRPHRLRKIRHGQPAVQARGRLGTQGCSAQPPDDGELAYPGDERLAHADL